MNRYAKRLAGAVAVVLIASSPWASEQAWAQEGDGWQVTLQSEESTPGSGWYKIKAWAKNISGRDLSDCTFTLSVSGNGQAQPPGDGPVRVGDARNGATLYYEFVIYSEPGGGQFNCVVSVEGLIIDPDI